jgi:hypothetical protein
MRLISLAPGLASKFGATPQDIKDAQIYDEQLRENPTVGKLMSGAAGFASGATLGGTDALYKLAGAKNVTDTINQLKQDYPTANLVGNIGGGVASSLLLPGAGSALAAKGGYLAGKSLIPTLARAGLNAASFAVPTAVTQTIANGGDVGQSAKDLGVNMFLGTVGGAAIEKILGGASNLVGKFKRGVQNASLAGDLGINGKAIKSVVEGAGGNPIERAQNLKDQLIELANKTKGTASDIATEAGKMKTVQTMENNWDTLVDKTFDAYKQQGGKLTDFASEIYNDPRIQDLVNLHPEMIDTIDNILNTASKRAEDRGIGAARKFLRDSVIEPGKVQGASDPRFYSSTIGDVVHDVTDAHFVPPELKATYARDLTLKKVLTKEEYSIPKPAQSGSQTAARLAAGAILTGAGGSALGPAGLAVGLGGMANTALAGGINKGLGKAATRLYPHLADVTGQGLANLAGPAGEMAAKLGGEGQAQNVAGALGAGNTIPVSTSPMGTAPQQVQPVPVPPPVNNVPTGAQPNAQAPVQNAAAPSHPPVNMPSPQEQANDKFVNPEPTAQTSAWKESELDSRLQYKYSQYVRQYGQNISFDQYKAGAAKATNNFDPMLESTWKGMIDDPATATKMYNGYMGLQKMKGVQVENALNHYLTIFSGAGKYSLVDHRKDIEDNAKLVNALSDMTKQPAKDIDARLRQIAYNKSMNSEQKKSAVTDMIVNEGGVDVPWLIQHGLWG